MGDKVERDGTELGPRGCHGDHSPASSNSRNQPSRRSRGRKAAAEAAAGAGASVLATSSRGRLQVSLACGRAGLRPRPLASVSPRTFVAEFRSRPESRMTSPADSALTESRLQRPPFQRRGHTRVPEVARRRHPSGPSLSRLQAQARTDPWSQQVTDAHVAKCCRGDFDEI